MTAFDVRKEIATLTKVRSLQAEQARSLEEQSRLLRDALLRTEVCLAVLEQQLVTNRDSDEAGRKTKTVRSVVVGVRDEVRSADAVRQRSPARRLVIAALEKAGSDGLTARQIDDLVKAGGMHLDTSQKAKAALKATGVIAHDPGRRVWYAAGRGPAEVEAERRARKTAAGKEAKTRGSNKKTRRRPRA